MATMNSAPYFIIYLFIGDYELEKNGQTKGSLGSLREKSKAHEN